MTDIDFQKYWSDKTSSLNRGSDETYYKDKAVEHAAIMSMHGKPASTTDYGCGDGKLLRQLHRIYKAQIEGIDYSESIIVAARQNLADTDISIRRSEAGEWSENCTSLRWTSCGAVNQYKNHEEMQRFLASFINNTHAKQLFLFDTIDPTKYLLFKADYIESYFDKGKSQKVTPKALFKRIYICLFSLVSRLSKRPFFALNEMGFGIKPRYWKDQAKQLDLTLNLISSLKFEYRYHVVLTKNAKSKI